MTMMQKQNDNNAANAMTMIQPTNTPDNNLNADELFARVADALDAAPLLRSRIMHETLVILCSAALKHEGQAYGNLFSQLAALCRMLHISSADTHDIQTMRRHSNATKPMSDEDFGYDCRALALLISAATGQSIPSHLTQRIPAVAKSLLERQSTSITEYLRCIVTATPAPSDTIISVEADADGVTEHLRVCLIGDITDHTYLARMITRGTQLNLLNATTDDDGTLHPRLIVLEPDFLIDISVIASCFEDFGHHPLLYTLNRMKPRPNTQATLLGNFAGSALDDIINNQPYDISRTMQGNFREKAMEYATCPGFDAQRFKADATQQANNIIEAVKTLFPNEEREKALLEPSFVCERLGIQGRVDLMTTDKQLLVEQKSGANYYIASHRPNRHGSLYIEKHFVQVLLYYGVLHYNFNLKNQTVDIRLLYSKFPPSDGLLSVEMYNALFAIALRNRIVAGEYFMARRGFDKVINSITAQTLNTTKLDNFFYNTYLLPQINHVADPLHHLSPLEHSYFCRMMTFLLREQLYSKTGAQEGVGTSAADLWNMPLKEKLETGNIFVRLTIKKKEKSNAYGGYDTITLNVPEQDDDFLPNFRQGDMVYLYAYRDDETPDVRHSILFKGTLAELHTTQIVVHLNDGQQNPHIFGDEPLTSTHTSQRTRPATVYAVEHAGSDIGTSSAIQAMHTFITATQDRRDLLLSQRTPKCDTTLQLSRHYDDVLNPILLRAKQARDYFLLVGPPGTGKTSRALRFIVEEELADEAASVLLMSYTNRAVDEICSMLNEAGISFMRIGNEWSCDARFRQNLISHITDNGARLDTIASKIRSVRVVVGTTSTLMARPFLFAIKSFSLAIIDEAGQITEPNIAGLLATHDTSADAKPLISRFILIGDYKQLPAVVQQSEQESAVTDPLLNAIGMHSCRDSLFERLIRHERQCGREQFIGILQRQGRMHPDIAEFPNKMFYFREHLQPVPLPHQQEMSLPYLSPSTDTLDDTLKSHRMVFIASEACHTTSTSDKVNTAEAKIVTDCLRRIARFYGSQFDAHSTVGIIVPYRNQIALLRKEIAHLQLPQLEDITIDTVERFQGSQRDVIIYSFTIHSQWQMNFLTANCFNEDGHTIDRKLNVAITRARRQMIMTGNPQVLSKNAVFLKLMQFIKEKGGYIGTNEYLEQQL